MTAPTVPHIICRGTPTQAPCARFDADRGECRHPYNMRPDVVNGGLMVHFPADYMRDVGQKCGPQALLYYSADNPF